MYFQKIYYLIYRNNELIEFAVNKLKVLSLRLGVCESVSH